jgi:hypothetical protein
MIDIKMIHLARFHRKAKGPKCTLICRKQALQNHQEQDQKIKNLIRPREQRFHIMKTTKNKTTWGIKFANHRKQYQEDHSDNHKYHEK